MEDDMDKLVTPSQAASRLGVFFMGLAAPCFVSLYPIRKDSSGPPGE